MDAETKAFLALDDFELAAWTPPRAADKGLDLPPAVMPGVIENIGLLKTQSALFIAALGDRAGDTSETFQP